jgi:hypothetical protein
MHVCLATSRVQNSFLQRRPTSGCTGARAAEIVRFGRRRRAGPVNLDVRQISTRLQMRNIEAALRMLGYDALWLESGFLSVDELQNQWESVGVSSSPQPEHYRFAAFCSVLDRCTAMTDTDIARFVRLAAIDPDPIMATAALGRLVMWPGITAGQLGQLATDAAFQSAPLRRLVHRRELLAAITPGQVSDAFVETCLDSGDADVQRALLANADLTADQLASLVRGGQNKALRNLALQETRRRFKDLPN